ncbi:MAG: hypothetical protein Q7S82_00010 [bacterium]|nr:hypothetical protein [bacterium]
MIFCFLAKIKKEVVMISWVSKHSTHKLLEVDPGQLLARLYHGFHVDQTKFPPLIDKMERGGELDAPIVTTNEKGLSIVDGEGIHRIMLSIIFGFRTIMIAVPADEITVVERSFAAD